MSICHTIVYSVIPIWLCGQEYRSDRIFYPCNGDFMLKVNHVQIRACFNHNAKYTNSERQRIEKPTKKPWLGRTFMTQPGISL